MKKNYVKPVIEFQSLLGSLSVSSGCAMQTTNAQMICPVPIEEWGGVTVFQEASGCFLETPDATDYVCYHVPMANMNVFES